MSMSPAPRLFATPFTAPFTDSMTLYFSATDGAQVPINAFQITGQHNLECMMIRVCFGSYGPDAASVNAL